MLDKKKAVRSSGGLKRPGCFCDRVSRRKLRIVLASAATVLLVSQQVRAAGLDFPDAGTVAIGRGTAFTARADNPTALYYNPAGLSKHSGWHVLISGGLVIFDSTFLRQGDDQRLVVEDGAARPCGAGETCVGNPSLDYSNFATDTRPFRSVSSSNKLGPAPIIAAVYGDAFGVEGLALSAGLLVPTSFGAPAYPKDGAQRYALQEASLLMAYPTVGVSYAWGPWLRIGATFMSGFALINQSQAIRPEPLPNDPDLNEDIGGDARLTVDVSDGFIPTGSLGVLSQPIEWLEFGASVRFPARVEASGKVKYEAPSSDLHSSHLVPGEDGVTVKQSFPWVVRGGVRLIQPRFDVEVDVVWEQWSSLESFEIDMDATLDLGEGRGIEEMPDANLPKNFRDTWSVRLGSDVEVWREVLTVRVGGFYQSSAYPKDNATFNLDFPFAEQVGLGGGLTVHIAEWIEATVGYQHIFQPRVVVDSGVVQQQGQPTFDGQQIGNTVNNGRYDVSIDVLGISAEASF